MPDKGQHKASELSAHRNKDAQYDTFVLEKSIFSNVFEKDIRRVFIYKKAERLAKAIHLIVPAFAASPSLRDRIDRIAIGLVDAAVLPPVSARDALSRELLALSSVLSVARAGGMLSSMNADLIAREAHLLLQEVAAYEEPRLFLDEAPTLSDIARKAAHRPRLPASHLPKPLRTPSPKGDQGISKGQQTHIKDNAGRAESVLAVLRSKGQASIKDISTVVRNVSEKTIQRELQALVERGVVKKTGQRRWSTYQLA